MLIAHGLQRCLCHIVLIMVYFLTAQIYLWTRRQYSLNQ